MLESCLPKIKEDPMIIIRRWQLVFCEGDPCAAALMSFFAYWHDIRLAIKKKNKQANDTAETHGDQRTQDESLWQFHSQDELRAGIMRIYSHEAITKALLFLQRNGVIEISKNPNARYAFDKTKFFLFHPEIFTTEMMSKYDPKNTPVPGEKPKKNTTIRSSENGVSSSENRPRWPEIRPPQSENELPCSEILSPQSENEGAIPEITSEVPSEITKKISSENDSAFFVSQNGEENEDKESDTAQPVGPLLKNPKFQELFIQEREKERQRKEAAGVVLKEPRLARVEEKPQPKTDTPLTDEEAEFIAEAEIVLRVKKIGLAGKESKLQCVAHALKQAKERGKSAQAVVKAWGHIPEDVAVHADLARFYEALGMPLTSEFADHNMKHVGSIMSDVMRNMSQGGLNGTEEAH